MGVFDKRPPQSISTFVWVVGVLLSFARDNCSKSEELNIADHNQNKSTALLALTSASAVSIIQHLNVKFMIKGSYKVIFHFLKS